MAAVAVKTIKSKPIGQLDRLSTTSVSKRNSSSDTTRIYTFEDRPKPIDFDKFLPWVCSEMNVPEIVTVTRINQEKIIDYTRSNSAKTRSTRSTKAKSEKHESCNKVHISTSNTISTITTVNENRILVTAYYNLQGFLVEIAIGGSTVKIPKKVIQAINLCVPFHPYLVKLGIRNGGLHSALIKEIGKLLPHSHLTDICLNDTNVPEGNYFILLDQASHLKFLSLCRCGINDEVSTKIFSRLEFGCPAEKTVMLMDVSFNFITDLGAKAISEVLRKNRHILHLNLAGNSISDIGLSFIMNNLSEFPLTYEESVERKRRLMEYTKKKLDVIKKNLAEISIKTHEIAKNNTNSSKRPALSSKHAKFKKSKRSIIEDLSRDHIAEKMSKEIIGEFRDPFDNDNVIIKDGYHFCVGNFKLCSLNLAYNKLEFSSLVKIVDVLKYQHNFENKSQNTGLIRMVLDGNLLPETCDELESIEKYLSKATVAQLPISPSPLWKRRTCSISSAKNR